MDNGTLSLAALGLGSTIGLAFIAGIGVSSNLGRRSEETSSKFDSDHPSHSPQSPQQIPNRFRPTNVLRIFLVPWKHAYQSILLLASFAQTIKKEYNCFKLKYREVYGPLDWRNVCKILRIFEIWEPVPYDLMIGRSQDELKQPLEDRRHCGFIGVCLRFRKGHILARESRTGSAQYLYDRRISVPAYLPLERDGSLRVDSIRERFHIDEVEALLPGRYKIYRVSKGEVISPVMLHQLIQEFGYVNIVEYEDIYCLQRRHFRQWLLSTKIHYYIRIACYLASISTIVLAACFVSTFLSSLYTGEILIWWCLSNVIGSIFGMVSVVVFFEHRWRKIRRLGVNVIDTKGKSVIEVPWHTFPSRYSVYRLTDLGQSYFL